MMRTKVKFCGRLPGTIQWIGLSANFNALVRHARDHEEEEEVRRQDIVTEHDMCLVSNLGQQPRLSTHAARRRLHSCARKAGTTLMKARLKLERTGASEPTHGG
jgi:hypothetical protein